MDVKVQRHKNNISVSVRLSANKPSMIYTRALEAGTEFYSENFWCNGSKKVYQSKFNITTTKPNIVIEIDVYQNSKHIENFITTIK